MPNFNVALDGKADMMSLNPLEMTNFEMMGFIFGVTGLVLTILLNRLRNAQQRPHRFVEEEVPPEGAPRD